MAPSTVTSSRNLIASAFVAFAAFGAFWGVWGASVPRVQDRTGVTDGQLGLALLFVGAGALPAMLLVGRALDRWGLKVAALVLSALGVIGAGLALTAVNLLSLCIGLTLVGASSGAADVAGRRRSPAGRSSPAPTESSPVSSCWPRSAPAWPLPPHCRSPFRSSP
jgi:predicted MFS family arabinose efflux permease